MKAVAFLLCALVAGCGRVTVVPPAPPPPAPVVEDPVARERQRTLELECVMADGVVEQAHEAVRRCWREHPGSETPDPCEALRKGWIAALDAARRASYRRQGIIEYSCTAGEVLHDRTCYSYHSDPVDRAIYACSASALYPGRLICTRPADQKP